MSLAAPILMATMTSCYTHHEVETNSKVETTHKIELDVKPMYIKIDVNLKVDKELDDFFDDIDDQDATMRKNNTENTKGDGGK
jgi:hypothetical protein